MVIFHGYVSLPEGNWRYVRILTLTICESNIATENGPMKLDDSLKHAKKHPLCKVDSYPSQDQHLQRTWNIQSKFPFHPKKKKHTRKNIPYIEKWNGIFLNGKSQPYTAQHKKKRQKNEISSTAPGLDPQRCANKPGGREKKPAEIFLRYYGADWGCIYIYIYTYIHIYIWIDICIYGLIYVYYVFVCLFAYLHICIYDYMYLYIPIDANTD